MRSLTWCSGLLLLSLLLIGCSEKGSVSMPKLVVDTVQVGNPVAKSQRKFHGRVVPADLTRVAFRISGKIAQLPVQSGQTVKRGDTLATVDAALQRQDVADAKARFLLSQRQLQRAETLLRAGAITVAQRDEIKAGFRLARANFDLAKNRLKHTVVTAPFDGVVLDVAKEVFEAVSPGESVVSIYRVDRVDVLIDLPDDLPAQIHRMKDRSSYQLDVNFAGEEGSFSMSPLENSTARNPQTQTFQFWLSMPSKGRHYPPGLPVTVNVDLEKSGFKLVSGRLIPLSALQAGAERGAFRAWRYRDGKVYSSQVNISRVTQEGVLVSAGLQSGDRVVTSSLSQLSEGLEVDLAVKIQEQK